tara:strand:- start:907 stop:1347 length:441 start_codon:yes stop_codon:yes gene_type:complete
MPYIGSKPTDAPLTGPTQAALEAETNEDTYVTPDLIRFSPGVAKAWINMTGTGTPAINASYNVASITDNATGDFTVTFDDDFSGANNYTASGFAYNGAGTSEVMAPTVTTSEAAPAAGAFRFACVFVGGESNSDREKIALAFHGDQ